MKTLSTCLTILLFFFFIALTAQSPDVSLPNALLDSAKELKKKKQLDEALIVNKKAIQLYESIVGREDSLTGYAYRHLGHLYRRSYNFDQALKAFHEMLDINTQVYGKFHPNVASAYYNIARILYNQGKYKETENVCHEGIAILEKVYNDTHYDLVPFYDYLTKSAQRQSNFIKAEEYLEKDLLISTANKGEYDSGLAVTYVNFGSNYILQGDYHNAQLYYQKAHDILVYNSGEDDPVLRGPLHLIGIVYVYQNQLEKAEECFQKSLAFKLKVFPQTHLSVGDTYSGLARIKFLQKDYHVALKYYNKVKDIFEKHTELQYHHHRVGIYSDIGNTLIKLHQYEKALSYFQHVLEVKTKAFKDVHPELTEAYYDIAQVYEKQGHFTKATAFYNDAVKASGYRWADQNINELEYNLFLLKAIEQLAKYRSSIDVAHIPSQKGLIDLLFKIQTHFNQIISDHESRVDFKNNVYSGFETSLQIVLEWMPREPEMEFSILERSKTSILLSEMRNNYINAFHDLPDALREKDHDLKLSISQLEKKRFKALQKEKEQNDSLVRALNDQIFALKQEQESLLETFEEDYPDFYQLKYDTSTVSISTTQSLLTQDQALIAYFVGDSTIYVFMITPTQYETTIVKKDFPLEEWVDELRHAIYAPHIDPDLSEIEKERLHQQYVYLAHELYKRLIQPIPLKLPERLIIIPDGALTYLPFDVLLKSKPGPAEQYRSFPYLLKEHAISYNYSASLYQQICGKQYRSKKKKILAVAPHFKATDTDTIKIDSSRGLAVLRSSLSPLHFNTAEVGYLSDQFDGDTLIGNHAILPAFYEMAKDYQIIHLSTHGIINDKMGDYSYLAFTETNDSIDNEKLYLQDLYNMELHADMVVLSSCETGLGKLKRGEGIFSLTRGFTYAGAKSVITTLWKVNDRSSKYFMQYFYDGLNKGLPKDVALQQAKLTLLERDYPDPFYWSGFIPMGDMKPVDLKPGFSKRYLFVLAIGVLFVMVYLRDKK